MSDADLPRAEDQLEVHYIGELEVGLNFPGVAYDEGICVEYAAQAGGPDGDWLAIARPEGFLGQTQTAYADEEGAFVFSHPLDFFFISTSIAEWPRLHLEVLKLDSAGCVATISYGSITLPVTQGHAELTCRTWTPMNDSPFGEVGPAHQAGAAPQLAVRRGDILDARSQEVRAQLVTKASGEIHISVDTVFRNAANHGLLPSAATSAARRWQRHD